MSNVRTHTRRTANGKTTTVHRHSRKGRGRHGRRNTGVFRPRRAAKNAKRAWRAIRRDKKGAAFMYGSLAMGEMAGFLTLRGIALTLTTVGLVAMGVAYAASKATGDK